MVILITHQHQFLATADKVLYIEEGKQVACGSFDEIMSLETKFIETLVSKGDQSQEKTLDQTVEVKSAEKPEESEEHSSKGFVKLADVLFYIKSSSTLFWAILCTLLKIAVHGGIVFYELRLGIFATVSGQNLMMQSMCSENSVNNTCQLPEDETHDSFLWYAISYVVVFLAEVCYNIFFFEIMISANENIHSLALLGVVKFMVFIRNSKI